MLLWLCFGCLCFHVFSQSTLLSTISTLDHHGISREFTRMRLRSVVVFVASKNILMVILADLTNVKAAVGVTDAGRRNQGLPAPVYSP